MLKRQCPRADELDALAQEQPVSTSVKRHARTCERCATIVAELKANADLVAELREAVSKALDAPTREHLNALCDRIAAKASRRTK
jgi:hypothetical protein